MTSNFVLEWLSDKRPELLAVKRALCCGDRGWSDPQLVHDFFDSGIAWALPMTRRPEEPGICSDLPQRWVITIIHGGCRGADQIAAYVARQRPAWYAVEEFVADWKGRGKAAGPLRNQRMLSEGKPDLVVAFHDYLAGSKGTKDMTQRALTAGLPVVVVSHAPKPGEKFVAPERAVDLKPRRGLSARVAGME
jgi:hypothetical protein